MNISQEFEWILRLLLALFLGYFIGLERQMRGQAAGERTHALVALGSALFVLVSLNAFTGEGTSRVASNIVTGLGFLGAGMIIKEQHEIHGLTTAAGIWAVGGVGMCIGLGEYGMGTLAAFLIWLLLISERILRLDDRLKKFRSKN